MPAKTVRSIHPPQTRQADWPEGAVEVTQIGDRTTTVWQDSASLLAYLATNPLPTQPSAVGEFQSFS